MRKICLFNNKKVPLRHLFLYSVVKRILTGPIYRRLFPILKILEDHGINRLSRSLVFSIAISISVKASVI